MSNFAIVQIGGKQYKVTPGDELLVDRLEKSDGVVVLDKVLLLVGDGGIKVGSPFIPGASIAVKVLGEEKGKKLDVIKFRAKSRYRRKIGFRAALTRIKIEEIKTTSTKQPSTKRSTKK